MPDDKVELSNIQVAPQDEAQKSSGREDPSYIERQTRTRRLFSTPQIFAFTVMYYSTWQGVGANIYFALINGGPAALFFNLLIAMVGATSQALALGEVASIMPIAGAQYYWSYHFAPPRARKVLAWFSGWTTWLGYICGLATMANTTTFLQQAGIQINFPDYEITGQRTTGFIIANLAALTILNIWLFRLVPWIELMAGVLSICFFFITTVSLWVMSPRNSADLLIATAQSSGWDSTFVSWNVGMLAQVWMFVGFEAPVHMGEETKNPGRAIPFTMVWSIVVNGLTGLVITATYIICMPNIDDLVAAPYPLLYLFEYATNGSRAMTTLLMFGHNIVSFACAMSFYTSASRMTWAWARDGALPSFFGHVHGKRRVPVRAIALSCTVVALLALLNLASEGFIAYGAITSMASLALYFSYAIILSVILYIRVTTGLPKAAWSIGRWSIPVNVFALVYTCWTMVWLPFPTSVPVTAATMNYCGPVFLGVMCGAAGAWFVWARKNWEGPNLAIVDFILRSEGLK